MLVGSYTLTISPNGSDCYPFGHLAAFTPDRPALVLALDTNTPFGLTGLVSMDPNRAVV